MPGDVGNFKSWELNFSFFSIFSSFLCLLLLFALIKRSPRRSPPKLPPGPWKLPFIGNLHNVVGALPHRVLRDLSEKYGPLMHLQLGEVSTVVVSSPKMAEAFMKTHDVIFANRPSILIAEILLYGSRDIVFAPYGDYWRMVRKIVKSELLSKKRVQSFRRVREEVYLDLAKWVASRAGTTLNLSEKIFSKSYEITSRIAFGQRCKEHEEFISVVVMMLRLGSGFDVADMFPSHKVLHLISGMRPELERLHQRGDQIMEGIIKVHLDKLDKRKAEEGEEQDDLVDVLLKCEQSVDGEFTLTRENIKGIIMDIFTGGSDTSAATVDWALSEMIRNPTVLKKAQPEVRKVFEGETTVNEAKLEELQYLKLVIKETLRLHPAAPLLAPRESREMCEINGYMIPSKTKVIVNGWAINRDQKHWEDADTFDPERFRGNPVDFRGSNFEYIPFGAGRRICPGMDFGLANVELPLAMLLYHFDFELPEGKKNEDMKMTESFGAIARRKDSLNVIPRVYRHPSLA